MKKIALLFTVAAFAMHATGAEVPPCTLTIDSQEAFDQWTSVDANGDGEPYKFVYSTSGYALYKEHRYNSADDWMISPAITLEAGMDYKVSFTVKKLSSVTSDVHNFSVQAGIVPEASEMSTTIFTVEGFKERTPTEKSGTFTPTVSGDYYFGLHLTSANWKGDFAIIGMSVEKIVPHPGAITGLSVEAAPKGELAAVLTWTWPTVNDLGGALSSITGANIYRGTSSYFSVSESSLVGTVNVDATPGTEGTYTDASITSAGKYYYKVVPFNADGASTVSPSSVQSPYIGMASSISGVKNLTATLVEGSETTVSLTWGVPTATEGYFDPADVSYKITRSKDGATAVTLEENWHGELPYIDSTIAGLGSYVYNVYTIFNGSTSWSPVQSNAVVAGGALTLPYSNDFSSSNSISLFTLFHGAGGSRDWSRSSAALYYWGGPTADAWAVTPKFSLEAGKAYKVSFTARVNRASSPKNLAVAVGAAPTAEALSDVIFTETISGTYATAKEALFSVPANGVYYIGFHCFGDADSNDLYVDDLKIEEVATAPLAVTDAKAEAAPEGELKAVVSWINPLKTTAGGEMTVVDKVEVSRGGEVVGTLTDVAAGVESSITDELAEPGEYTYTITAYLGENASESVDVTTGWVGFDTPKAPESVTLTLGDEGERIIDFTAVTEGVHGGYIDAANLLYQVSRNDVVLTSEQAESPYIDSEKITELAIYTYSVAAVNGEYVGEAMASQAVTLGDALPLPYTPDFSSKDNFGLWTLGKWSYNSSKSALQNGTNNSWMFTPPLAMKVGECKVTFKATCYNAHNEEDMEIYLVTSTAEAPVAEEGTAMPVKVGDLHVDVVSFPSATEFKFPVASTGNYYLAVGQQTSKMYLYISDFSVEQTIDNSTAIEDVEAGAASEVRYFNLQGQEINRPAAGQIVIVSRDGRTTKEIFK